MAFIGAKYPEINQVTMSPNHGKKALELLKGWNVEYTYNQKCDRYEFVDPRDGENYHVFAIDTGELVTAVYELRKTWKVE